MLGFIKQKKIAPGFISSLMVLGYISSLSSFAWGQSWPAKTVKFIVPSAAASSPDRLTRLVAEQLSKKWGQSVIVENKPGATSMLGTDFVAKSSPDGYTLLSTFTSFVQIPALFKNITYNTERDLAPVTQMVDVETIFVVRGDSPYQTLNDFVLAAKKAKVPLSFGSFGSGSSFHIYGEKLAKAKNITLTHVPYKGEALSTMDLVGGQLDSSFASIGTALPFLKSGKLRALGIVMPNRSNILPDVPTFLELNAKPPDITGWFGVLAPGGTPEAITVKIQQDIKEILERPENTKILHEQGMTPILSTPTAFAQKIHEDLQRWRTLLPEVDIHPGD
jgi:tripartite-type tricarboxylate transporter receptor subunit TctC